MGPTAESHGNVGVRWLSRFLASEQIMSRFDMFMTVIAVMGIGGVALGVLGIWLKNHGYPY